MSLESHPPQGSHEQEKRERAINSLRNQRPKFASTEIFYPKDGVPKRPFYQYFRDKFCGDPLKGGGLPELTRVRSGNDVAFDWPILSAVTERCSHMIHVREARLDPNARGLPMHERFVLITADFGSRDIKEWGLKPSSGSYEGGRGIELVLEEGPEEHNDYIPIEYQYSSLFEELSSSLLIDIMKKDAQAYRKSFTLTDERAELSWGNFKKPETFVGIDRVERDLWRLDKAYGLGVLGIEFEDALQAAQVSR